MQFLDNLSCEAEQRTDSSLTWGHIRRVNCSVWAVLANPLPVWEETPCYPPHQVRPPPPPRLRRTALRSRRPRSRASPSHNPEGMALNLSFAAFAAFAAAAGVIPTYPTSAQPFASAVQPVQVKRFPQQQHGDGHHGHQDQKNLQPGLWIQHEQRQASTSGRKKKNPIEKHILGGGG